MQQTKALEIITILYNNHKDKNNEDELLLPMLSYAKEILNDSKPEANVQLLSKLKKAKENMQKWAQEEREQMAAMGLLQAGRNSPKDQMAQAFKTALELA